MLLTACAGANEPDEDRIRAAVAGMKAAVEAKKPRELVRFLATDYRDHRGRNRDFVRKILRIHFLRYRKVGVLITRLKVDTTVPGPGAEVQAHVLLFGGFRELLPENGRLYSFDTHWRLEDGEWRMSYAEWESLLGG
ncbi:MAG: hypothetical protein LJE84_13955 [Gammaproteobacteria bacterium]|nr:hypothetical protein [Gammaproteobacteria bacterium]